MGSHSGRQPMQLSAGIDYITVTRPLESDHAVQWHGRAFDAIRLIIDAGNKFTQASMLGYEGIAVGGSFLGERHDGYMCRISGEWAAPLWRQVYDEHTSVTRFDLQVTAWLGKETASYGHKLRRDAHKHNLSLPHQRQRAISWHEDVLQGYTLYIGSRTSATFMRIYNKGAESGDSAYLGAWRYEVQCNGDTASRTACHLFLDAQNEQRRITEAVQSYAIARGVKLPLPEAEQISVIAATSHNKSDNERSLAWLTTQVRPTVERLLAEGFADEVHRALGIIPQGQAGTLSAVTPGALSHSNPYLAALYRSIADNEGLNSNGRIHNDNGSLQGDNG